MINSNDPAFPTLHYNETTGNANGHSPGLSIRAELAARAMQGLLSNHVALTAVADNERGNQAEAIRQMSITAVKFADALIAELNKISL